MEGMCLVRRRRREGTNGREEKGSNGRVKRGIDIHGM
jgi:hypothetical protein